jgi:dTDP-glucose 4,6-dehydratase
MILVTGGAGFIGGNFVRMIADQNPIVMDKLSYASNTEYIKNIGILECVDIGDGELLHKTFLKYRNAVDTIIHFAAETHVDRSIEYTNPFIDTNIKGTVNLLSMCKLYDVKKFIHISTDEVFGVIEQPNKFNENSPISPRNPYSASKAAAEHFVIAYGNTYNIPYIIVNMSNNYGPNQHNEKLIPKILDCIKNDIPIPVYGNGKQIRDWLYVEDSCRAIKTIMEKGVIGERYCIGGENELTNLEIINMIIKKTGATLDLIKHVKDRLGHDVRYAVNNDKINTLGWKPTTSLSDGLDKTIDWYKNEGRI